MGQTFLHSMVAFRRPKNLSDILIKAQVPPTPQKIPRGQLKRIKACNAKQCQTCPYVKTGKNFKSLFNSTVMQLNSALSCASTNVVYCLLCLKENCQQIYIGQTKRQVKERFGEHKTSVRSNSKCAVAEHFDGHLLHDMQILALEKVFTPGILEKRESLYINMLEAEYSGLNRKQ